MAGVPSAFITAAPALDLTGITNSHDPSTLLRDGDTYFHFTTGNGVWYSRSTDLVHWHNPGDIFGSSWPAWINTAVPGLDYMTDFESWLSVQNGVSPAGGNISDPALRYIRNGRDIGHTPTQVVVNDPWGEPDLIHGTTLNANGMGLRFSRLNFGKRWMVEPIGGGAYRYAPGKGWAVVVDSFH